MYKKWKHWVNVFTLYHIILKRINTKYWTVEKKMSLNERVDAEPLVICTIIDGIYDLFSSQLFEYKTLALHIQRFSILLRSIKKGR